METEARSCLIIFWSSESLRDFYIFFTFLTFFLLSLKNHSFLTLSTRALFFSSTIKTVLFACLSKEEKKIPSKIRRLSSIARSFITNSIYFFFLLCFFPHRFLFMNEWRLYGVLREGNRRREMMTTDDCVLSVISHDYGISLLAFFKPARRNSFLISF
jgi:hypothetical protein